MFEKGFSISMLAACALALLAGVLCLNQLSELPLFSLTVVIVLAAIVAHVGLLRNNTCRSLSLVMLFFLLGILRAQLHAQDYLEHVLTESLAGTDIQVTGVITTIPTTDRTIQRFVLEVQQAEQLSAEISMPEKLRLSWYYGEPVHAGETWQFMVRLKPPHGFMNPGGFDYERWLYQQGIHATGYVRKSEHNRRIKPASMQSIVHLREYISDAIPESDFSGLIKALAIGERSGITQHQWNILITTGTNHLMAISGLHIGLASLFGYWISRRLVPTSMMLRLPVQHIAIVAGACVALLYAALAGFAIPTQRAMLMLCCIAGAWLFRRTSSPVNVLSVALILVLLWDPMAVLSAGFWFSFLAVSAIFYILTSTRTGAAEASFGERLKTLIWIQIAITLVLLPVSLFMFQQASLVSPIANLILVPYVSFTVVPLVLLALLVLPFSSVVANLLFSLASDLFKLVWPVLEFFTSVPMARWIQHDPGIMLMMAGLLGAFLLLSRASGHKRFAGVLLMIPMFGLSPAQTPHGVTEVAFLDVGQGLAVVVNTGHQVLVYDTGARFSERMDSGTSVLIPYLRHRGIRNIDMLIVSHGDNDHIGGAESLLSEYPATRVMGQGIDKLKTDNKIACRKGDSWQWNDVEFTILHPDDSLYKKTNNQSCVLRIDAPGGTVLLTGDIEKNVEWLLLTNERDQLDVDILLVPHHGSKSSSTPAFIEAVSPKIAVFASGYRNRYRLPSEEILQRYTQSDTKLYASGLDGAIEIKIDAEQGILEPEKYRLTGQKYWHHRPPQLRLGD